MHSHHKGKGRQAASSCSNGMHNKGKWVVAGNCSGTIVWTFEAIEMIVSSGLRHRSLKCAAC
jgi:hypothetical protein